MTNIAVLGAGNRSRALVKELLDIAGNDVNVVSIFDPDTEVGEKAKETWSATDAVLSKSAHAAITHPGVDWVMIFSPNAFHAEQILAAFAEKKHVFTEKPLATSIEDCITIQKKHANSGLLFATGFVLRYAPLYQAIHQLLRSGDFGPIISIAASENIKPAHGGYIMRNWRRYTQFSGPHILEKCCHDLDILNWMCDDIPQHVGAFGSNSVFIPKNNPLLSKYGRETFCSWEDPHAVDSPFQSKKDIMDNMGALMRYRNNVHVTFQITMSNAIPERRLFISCLEGTIIGELYTGHLQYRRLGDEQETVKTFPGGGHGGGDPYIMEALFQTMKTGAEPLCSGQEGLRSAIVALALDQAARERKIISLNPVWRKIGKQKA
ncbi:Gfo/Idh/MocA family oxidoreductase [Kiritimatiellota bacterium B12222]|nr:Gfo/Idh/MocA family oxidoreductase [Kiritimatiellota bacterium B12222]